MTKTTSIIIGLVTLFAACSQKQEAKTEEMNPPIAEKKPHEMTIHGHTRTDNYFWLKEREDEKVIKYLEDENAYTEAKLSDTKEFQKKL